MDAHLITVIVIVMVIVHTALESWRSVVVVVVRGADTVPSHWTERTS